MLILMRKYFTTALLLVLNSSYALPDNFIYLEQIAPEIIQEIRYAGNDNFVGKAIPGYDSARCILSKNTAEQLKKIQEDAKILGYGLKVYDCYRPQSAVDAFSAWSQNSDVSMKPWFYPHEEKSTLFAKSYIALKSGHSRGSTVDITLVSLKSSKSNTNHDPFEHANFSINMGAPFDYFDEMAHVFAKGLSDNQRRNRMLLRTLMLQNGFLPYPEEWWHFTLKDEPYPDTYFNFPVS
jgi:D-alanyl-D-alanine dipeptidase